MCIQQTNVSLKKLWRFKIPLKIKIFLWLLLRGRILTKDNLFKRGWKKGDAKCQFCDQLESIQHLFFDCPLARLIWSIICCAFEFKPASSSSHLFGDWLDAFGAKLKPLVITGVAAMIWAIWKTRNKACFDKKKLPNDPTDIIFLLCHWMDSWAILHKAEADQRKLQLGAQLIRQITSDVFCSKFGWRPGARRIGC